MPEPAGSDPVAGGLDDVLITAELATRPSRAPDYETESRALGLLAREMAANPRGVLQKCAELVMELCHAESAGISILEPGGTSGVLRWHAAAGAFAPNLHGTMPREASPCGTVMERNCVLLFNAAEEYFPALRGVEPRIYENLLTPWHAEGEATGTLWAIKHSPEGRFDAEDARLLQSLARFAAAAFQMISALDEATAERSALRASEERQAFLLKLADGLRPLADPVEVQSEAARVLGEHMNAGRAAYAEIDADDAHFTVHRDYTDGVPSFAGRYPLDGYGAAEMWANLRAGRNVTVADAERDERLGEADRANYAAAQIRAAIAVPLVKRGRLSAVFFLHFTEPQEWSAERVAMVEETAERTWAAVERARVETALRESEEKYRTLFEEMDEGFALCELVRDDAGRAVDYRYIELNPAMMPHTGIAPQPLRGRLAREAFPDLDPWQLATYARVVDSGQSVLEEHYFEQIDRWLRVNAFPRGGDRFAVLYSDTTLRKRAEAELRQSEEKYRSLFEAMDEGFAICDLVRDSNGRAVDYRYVEVNPAVVRHVGILRRRCRAGWPPRSLPTSTPGCSRPTPAWSRKVGRSLPTTISLTSTDGCTSTCSPAAAIALPRSTAT